MDTETKETTMTYICTRYDGTVTWHVSREAANRAIRRSKGKKTVVECRRVDEKIPHSNDAAGWDAYRLRHGIASR